MNKYHLRAIGWAYVAAIIISVSGAVAGLFYGLTQGAETFAELPRASVLAVTPFVVLGGLGILGIIVALAFDAWTEARLNWLKAKEADQ